MGWGVHFSLIVSIILLRTSYLNVIYTKLCFMFHIIYLKTMDEIVIDKNNMQTNILFSFHEAPLMYTNNICFME